MLRTLALLLLLANALLLAALSGAFDGAAPPDQREPARLQRQHQNALVQILSPQQATAALAALSAQAAAAKAQAAAASAQAAAASAAAAAVSSAPDRPAAKPARARPAAPKPANPR